MISALSQRDDFLLLQRSGTIRRSGPLRARVVTDEKPPAKVVKLGFTIGRKFGSAVDRNRMRRRLRHCVVQVANEGAVDTTHVLLGASRSALAAPHPELLDHCRNLMVSDR